MVDMCRFLKRVGVAQGEQERNRRGGSCLFGDKDSQVVQEQKGLPRSQVYKLV